MKYIILLLLLPIASFGQQKNTLKVGAGISGGYSSTKTLVGEGYIQIKPSYSNFLFTPLSIKIHGSNDPAIPVIFESRLSYKVKFAELYTGLAFHAAGADGKAEYKKYKGFRPAGGIIIHPFKKIIITTGLSGNIWSVQLGLFDWE